MTDNTIRLIINADDLGMSHAVNGAIAELMESGKITSATIMANGPAVQEAIRIARHYSHCSFGVHLNLTEFGPMQATDGLKPILGPDSQFSGKLDSLPMTPDFLRAVAGELSRQIDYLRQSGVALSHLDSHQHVHTIPVLFPSFKRAQRASGIRRMRISRTVPRGGGRYGRLMQMKKAAYNFMLKRFPGTLTTQEFCDFQTFLVEASQGRIRHCSYELMVHPGADPEETRLLCSAWQERLPWKVAMINYHQLLKK